VLYATAVYGVTLQETKDHAASDGFGYMYCSTALATDSLSF